MKKVTSITQRKKDHIQINLDHDVSSGILTGLDQVYFKHEALPEIDLEQVDTKQSLFGKIITAPILISSMTGGTAEAQAINRRLAETASEMGIVLGIGSQRAALEDPSSVDSYSITRKVAPNILIFANLGAVQLNYGYTIDHFQRAIDMIQADAIIVHLNPLQEALQIDGNTAFSGLAKKLEIICRQLDVPVIAKEVGWGISERTARILGSCGISAIDVAGAGGTSWSQVEMHRAPDDFHRKLATAFRNWGIPTRDSIGNVKKVLPNLPIFASGGIRDGIDIAKCIALGACLGGMAGPFLKTAAISTEKTIEQAKLVKKQIEITMFCVGARNLASLSGCLA